MQWTAAGLTRPKPLMPPSRKHHNRIRDLVLLSAGRLFNRHGFNAVSIDDVMAEAGLTRGSFYCYFSSKSDLYAQSVARVVHEDRDTPKVSGSERARADKIVHDYLTDADQNLTADIFPMIGLPNDFAHRPRGQTGIRIRPQIDDPVVRASPGRHCRDAARERTGHCRALCRRHGSVALDR